MFLLFLCIAEVGSPTTRVCVGLDRLREWMAWSWMLFSDEERYFHVTDKDDKAPTFDYSQQPSGNVYGAEATKHYYQVS